MHLAIHAAQHGPSYAKEELHELALGLERWPFEVWQRAAALAREVDAAEDVCRRPAPVAGPAASSQALSGCLRTRRRRLGGETLRTPDRAESSTWRR